MNRDETKTNLFAYGTLMWPEVFEAVVGRRLPSVPVVLRGFKRLRVKNACYPAIVRSPDDEVEGVIYRGLSGEEMRRLDAFEGAEYQRIECEVHDTRVSVYVFVDAFRARLEDAPWKPESIDDESRARFSREIRGEG